MSVRHWPAVIAATWLCAGCAAPSAKFPDLPDDEVKAERHRQQVAQVKTYFGALARLNNVAFKIKVANRQYCKAVAPQIGIYAATTHSLPRKYHTFSGEALQVDATYATVVTLADGSPAAVAGIKTGDKILTLDNEAVPAKKSDEWIDKWLAVHGAQPVTVMVRRDDKDEKHLVYPAVACAIPVVLGTDANFNAFTDYRKIVIQSGILRAAENDSDLAVVIGHELAHVNMGHYGKKLQNALLGAASGAVIDGGLLIGGIYTGGTFMKHFEVAGERTFSVDFEREADYVGAYYAARAGYDVSDATNIWRTMARESPDNIRANKTHPATPVRFVQMQKTIAEIEDKKRRNLPLEPDLKSASAEPAASADAY